MKGWCDGGRWGCGNPTTFVARCENVMPGSTWEYDDGIKPRTLSTTFEACGKHLAALLNAYPIPSKDSGRFLVVPINPNIEKL